MTEKLTKTKASRQEITGHYTMSKNWAKHGDEVDFSPSDFREPKGSRQGGSKPKPTKPTKPSKYKAFSHGPLPTKPTKINLKRETTSHMVDLYKALVKERERRGVADRIASGDLDFADVGDGDDDEEASSASSATSSASPSSDDKIPMGLFELNEVVDVASSGNKWDEGIITHLHKDGRYTITFKHLKEEDGTQKKIKRVHPKKLRSKGKSVTGGNVADNLRTLDKLEQADRVTQKLEAKSFSTKQGAESKPLLPEVRLSIAQHGEPGKQKVLVLKRKKVQKGDAGGLNLLLKEAKSKFNSKKAFKIAMIADGLVQLKNLDKVPDGTLVFVAVKAPSGMREPDDDDDGGDEGCILLSLLGEDDNDNNADNEQVPAENGASLPPPLTALERARQAYVARDYGRRDIDNTPDEDTRLQNAYNALLKDTSAKVKTIRQQRQRLPAAQEKNTILEIISKNNVTLISGSTGCGKTTQVPQFLIEQAVSAGNGTNINIYAHSLGVSVQWELQNELQLKEMRKLEMLWDTQLD
eukprot:m.75693 g.75693  ORF g.75693 m.75693 type:complete len:526 (-) comp12518_c0_seq1:2094-3671(-)